MAVKRTSSIEDFSKISWDALQTKDSPFLDYEFHRALERSGSVGQAAGWRPHYWSEGGKDLKAALITYEKEHSYGEYIFDWDWAQAYERMGQPYYPKMTSMIPFTPATTPHFLMPAFEENAADRLLEACEAYSFKKGLNSLHFLFITEDERRFFADRGYLLRDSLQYHFANTGYLTFADFLASLKSRKAKQIKKERKLPEDLSIERLTGDALTEDHAAQMRRLYLSTITKKQAYAYLQPEFFSIIFQKMKNNILFIRASRNDRTVAGALYFYNQRRLYGRYWGALAHIPNLHFELCFYQGIAFCIEKKIEVFEAGAQGEHKVPRGFRPVRTRSAHKIRNPGFRRGIEGYIADERTFLDQALQDLEGRLPYRR